MTTEDEERVARSFAQKQISNLNMTRWEVVFVYLNKSGCWDFHEVFVDADSAENAIYEAYILSRWRDGVNPHRVQYVDKVVLKDL